MVARGVLLVAALPIFGLLPPAAFAQPSDGVTRYRPDDSVLQRIDEEAAADALRRLSGGVGKWLTPPREMITGFQVLDDRLRLGLDGGGVREFRYAALSGIEAAWKDPTILTNRICDVTLVPGIVIFFADPECASSLPAFADALYVLMREAREDPEAERRFAEMAQRYRAMADKPAFPEEARRYRVQAEAAIRDKRLDVAARSYKKALKLAPWWPEGHFNRSLILAESGRHAEAIAHMRRYLMLVPEAQNARAAQDKIYEWEAKAGLTR